jgi:DNA-directed RNA polymerase specialized sigma24 family protein
MSPRTAWPEHIEAIYRERFAAFVLSVTALLGNGEDALDTVQEGFARALRQRRSFRAEGSLEGWIWRIVLNVARDRLRVTVRALPSASVEGRRGAFDVLEGDLPGRLLALPERQRLAVFLRYYGDLSYEQIAEALGVRRGTVAASLHAAHEALRHELEGAET